MTETQKWNVDFKLGESVVQYEIFISCLETIQQMSRAKGACCLKPVSDDFSNYYSMQWIFTDVSVSININLCHYHWIWIKYIMLIYQINRIYKVMSDMATGTLFCLREVNVYLYRVCLHFYRLYTLVCPRRMNVTCELCEAVTKNTVSGSQTIVPRLWAPLLFFHPLWSDYNLWH